MANDSFAASCRSKLEKVKALSLEKGSYEGSVIDKLEIISAVQENSGSSNNNKRGEIVMRYAKVSGRHLNNQGNIHGGALATWVDIVTSLAIWFMSEEPMVSVSLHVNYMNAASDKGDLYFYASVGKVGKTLSFATCRVMAQEGTMIATASHTVARAKL